MQDSSQIWEFGRWIAKRDAGSARLSWSEGELVLDIRGGRIHRIEGVDSGELAARLGCESAGEDDLLAEARALGKAQGIAETQAMGAAKEILQNALHDWLMDEDRVFDLETGEPREADGATISITHALVELILADTEHNVADTIIPDRGVVLQRAGGFLELYSPLRLSEEADLIVADINGDSSAAEIAQGSSHSPEEVIRLEAALVATGMLEASETTLPMQDLEWSGAELAEDAPTRKKLPPWVIPAAAAALVLVIVVLGWIFFSGGDEAASGTTGTGDWGVVVEMGCEPQDLQRMLRKRNQERKSLRTVKADPTNGDTCFRLVWGSFATQEAAVSAVGEIPSDLIEDGFEPHVIELTDTPADGEIEAGE